MQQRTSKSTKQPSSGLPGNARAFARSQVCNLCGTAVNKTGPAALRDHQRTNTCLTTADRRARPAEEKPVTPAEPCGSVGTARAPPHSSTPVRRSYALVTNGDGRSPPLFTQMSPLFVPPTAIKNHVENTIAGAHTQYTYTSTDHATDRTAAGRRARLRRNRR